ncbi:hypothetical protein ACIHAX_35255 [Nocardia sp. NPDC051929]|uniref:hypothetical protein n=1 Tax=unclassified Nocardia TaxID=2637762 RepID=UPI0034475B86
MRSKAEIQFREALRAIGYGDSAASGSTVLGDAGLGLAADNLIELVLAMEKRLGVTFPDTSVERLAAMAITEMVSIFDALVDRNAEAIGAQLPTRADVISLLGQLNGADAEVPEQINSLARTWLLHSMEQRYGQAVLVSSDELHKITDVDSAVEVLRRALRAHVPTPRAPSPTLE